MRFGLVSSGPANNAASGSMVQSFTIQDDVTQLPISFFYNFVSEEFPEFCDSVFDDTFRVTLSTTAGSEDILVTSVNQLCETPLQGVALNFPGGDDTTQATGWQAFSGSFTVAPGPATLTLAIDDLGDDIFDTEILIDGLSFSDEPSTNAVSASGPPSLQLFDRVRLGFGGR